VTPEACPGQRVNEARLQCPQCGYPFGRLTADRRHPTFTPGLLMVIDLALQRVDVTCPRCGLKRSFTDVEFSAMAIPKVAVGNR
jgi:rubredoxin